MQDSKPGFLKRRYIKGHKVKGHQCYAKATGRYANATQNGSHVEITSTNPPTKVFIRDTCHNNVRTDGKPILIAVGDDVPGIAQAENAALFVGLLLLALVESAVCGDTNQHAVPFLPSLPPISCLPLPRLATCMNGPQEEGACQGFHCVFVLFTSVFFLSHTLPPHSPMPQPTFVPFTSVFFPSHTLPSHSSIPSPLLLILLSLLSPL